MTRETKIGLLVGLGFIIMFGMILGGRNDMPVETAGATAEGITGNPEWSQQQIGLNVRQPRVPEPVPPAPARQDSLAVQPSQTSLQLPQQQFGAIQAQAVEVQPRTVDQVPPAVPSAAVVEPAMPTYKVVAGDSLYGIARKVYGQGGEYRRIYEANRDVLSSESSLRVGQTLRIPPLAQAAPGERGGQVVQLDAAGLQRYMANESRTALPVAATVKTYTVERGDTLSGIARRALGDDSPGAVRKLFEANKDKLASPDQLKIGMVLKIPQ